MRTGLIIYQIQFSQTGKIKHSITKERKPHEIVQSSDFSSYLESHRKNIKQIYLAISKP